MVIKILTAPFTFKKKIKEMNGSVDSVSIKIENGDTTIDMNIRTNALADVADDEEEGSGLASTKSTTKQAGRILFLWHSLLRFGI